MRFEVSVCFPIVMVLGVVLQGCGAPSLPRPELLPHQVDGATVVSHPPPAALPEIVSPQPAPDALWVDGHWIWQGREWFWKRGGWVQVPKGVRLTFWQTWYEEDGTLLFSDSRWLDPDGSPRDEPEIVKPAASPPKPTLSEEATTP